MYKDKTKKTKKKKKTRFAQRNTLNLKNPIIALYTTAPSSFIHIAV